MQHHEGMPPLDTTIEQELRSRNRVARWMEKLKAIRAIRDALGHPVERGVEEPIAGLNLLGIPTVASREGHIDHGYAVPCIEVRAFDRPSERFVGEGEVIAKTAEKYGVSEKDVLSGIHPVAWKEAHKGMSVEETAAYRLWQERNEQLKGQVERSARRVLSWEVKVGVEGFRIHNGGQDYVRRRDEPNALSPLEQQARAEGLAARQFEICCQFAAKRLEGVPLSC
jgi:hypothetical protein